MDLDTLRSFLVDAHRNTYATSEPQPGEIPHEKRLQYEDRPFWYIDRYHGSRSFVGREVVYEDGTPAWAMTYRGRPTDDAIDHEPVYEFLRRALGSVSEAAPFRGPAHFERDSYRYESMTEGTLADFEGTETIEDGSGTVYRGHYNGGLVE